MNFFLQIIGLFDRRIFVEKEITLYVENIIY